MVRINSDIELDENELECSFVRAGGPGGQKTNKTSSAVQLRFDARHSPSLPFDVRQRLLSLAGSRATEDGEVIIEASQYRSQDRNRQDALDRLVDLIRQAAHRPRKRRKTRPSRAAKKRRLEDKRKHSSKKQMRGTVRRDEY